MNRPLLSLVIPTRNEQENVTRLLERCGEALSGLAYDVVFVDDSTDGTDAVLSSIVATDPRVRVHHRERDNGVAGAVVDGFAMSRGQVLAVIDADLQHPPGLLPVMLRRLEEERADLVVASRFLSGGGAPGLGPFRRAVSRASRLVAHVLLQGARRTSDPLSGYFAVRRAVIEDVTLRPVGYKILLEILVRGRYTRVTEVPCVPAGRRAGTTGATIRQGITFLRHVAGLVAASPADSRLWKFLLVGASGVAVNMVVFWFLAHLVGIQVVLSGAVAGVISTFTNFLLNNAYTWADRREQTLSVFLVRLGKYYVATGVGNLIYLSLLWGLTRVGLVPLLANLVAVGTGGLLNYVVHNLWTWRAQRAP